jgi:phosphate-selective porin OprO/OprP
MKLAPKLLAAAVLAALSTPALAEITIDVIGGSEVSFEGLVQMDHNDFDSDVARLNGDILDGSDADSELRRAEIVLKGKGPGMFNWVVGYDAKADKFLDTNLQYRFSGVTTLTVGQYKQPNSLEELSSTKNNDFISKAMVTNTFGVARRTGVQLATGGDTWTLTGSAFGRELTRNLAHGSGYGARFTWAPINESGNFLHLGLSAMDYDTDGDVLRIRTRPQADLAANRLVDTGTINRTDRQQTLGVEGLWVNGPVKVQSEYMQSSVDRYAGQADFDANSWYVSGVWNVTGETWTYSKGMVSTVLPNNPASGMWQVGLRYDSIDLDDGLILGGEQDSWTAGVNWYWRSNYKFSANYTVLSSDRRGISDDPNILSLRAQFYW